MNILEIALIDSTCINSHFVFATLCALQHPSLQDLCERVLGSSVDLLAVILSTGDGVPICRGKPKRKTQETCTMQYVARY
jgi:hypothetical protein